MPAVNRSPRAPSQTPRSRMAAGRGRGASVPAKAGAGLDRALAVKAVSVLAAGVVIVVLATGGRGHALAAAAGHGVDARLGALGLKVRRVELQGVSPASARDVLAAAAVPRGEPILGLDLEAVRARVEAVGWVRSARVLRLLPDTVVISATERPRLAVWQVNGRAVVVDAEGSPIPEADPARFPDLPLVVGQGANEAAAAVLPLLRARPRLAAQVDAFVRVDGRRWDLRLKDGGLIQLPSAGEDAALLQLDQIDARSHLLELGFARVDLRDPEMVTVRPRGAPAAAGASPPPATAA